MDIPSISPYSNAYLTIINEKRIDCYQYGNVAQRKRAVDKDFSEKLEKFGESTSAASQPPKPAAVQLVRSETADYYQNGILRRQRRCEYSDGTVQYTVSAYGCPQTK